MTLLEPVSDCQMAETASQLTTDFSKSLFAKHQFPRKKITIFLTLTSIKNEFFSTCIKKNTFPSGNATISHVPKPLHLGYHKRMNGL